MKVKVVVKTNLMVDDVFFKKNSADLDKIVRRKKITENLS